MHLRCSPLLYTYWSDSASTCFLLSATSSSNRTPVPPKMSRDLGLFIRLVIYEGLPVSGRGERTHEPNVRSTLP